MKREIHLAGGCFWGVERYLSLLPGVVETQVCYANGRTQNPSYEQVCRENTGHAEAVRVVYDPQQLPLGRLLDWFYEIIDPTLTDRQGNDRGTQYRTGVYYTDPADLPVIQDSIRRLQEKYSQPVVTQVLPLENSFPAEEYHQDYLVKNPGGYCHISLAAFDRAREYARQAEAQAAPRYEKKPKEELRKTLSDLQYRVTQENATEAPFQNPYDQEFRPGIYLDITTGQPLFVSTHKFDAGCGWPSFSRPIAPELLAQLPDNTLARRRTEVRSRDGDAHLGHVFEDGPRELGGLRYCINSASLRFVPREEMEAQGLGGYLPLLEEAGR